MSPITHIEPRTFAQAQPIVHGGLDPYARRGVVLSRDAAHAVMASLGRDAFDMERRGGEANLAEVAVIRALRDAIGAALR